jgi:methionine aminopeptidase type I
MIIYKSEEEISAIRRSNRIVADILAELREMIKPGIQTKELDKYAESKARSLGAIPAFKGYRGFPASLCISVNEEIVHGIPSARILREGDIVSLDFGVIYDGYYGDAAVTYPVGEVRMSNHGDFQLFAPLWDTVSGCLFMKSRKFPISGLLATVQKSNRAWYWPSSP